MKKTFATIGTILAFAALTACGSGDGANDGPANGDNNNDNGIGTETETNGSNEAENMDYENTDSDTIDASDDGTP